MSSVVDSPKPFDLVDDSLRSKGPMSYPLEPPTPVQLARKAHASPGVRAFARQLGVDLLGVMGSGPSDRVLIEDVQGYVRTLLAEIAGAGARHSSAEDASRAT